MGQLTVNDIIDEAAVQVVNQSVEARDHVKALFLNWLREQALTHSFPELETDPAVTMTLSVGVSRYALPNGFIRDLKISIKDERTTPYKWRPLDPLNSYESYRQIPDRDEQGFPTSYTVTAKSFYIYKTPNGAYTIQYTCQLFPAVPADTDKPWLESDNAMISYVKSLFLDYDARLDEADVNLSRAEKEVAKARDSRGRDMEISGNRVSLDPHYYGRFRYGSGYCRPTKDDPLWQGI